MEIEIKVHVAEEGGYWAEVPSIPGCVTEGDTIAELAANLQEAVDGCLYVMAENIKAILEQNLQETIFENSKRQEVVLSCSTKRVAA